MKTNIFRKHKKSHDIEFMSDCDNLDAVIRSLNGAGATNDEIDTVLFYLSCGASFTSAKEALANCKKPHKGIRRLLVRNYFGLSDLPE